MVWEAMIAAIAPITESAGYIAFIRLPPETSDEMLISELKGLVGMPWVP